MSERWDDETRAKSIEARSKLSNAINLRGPVRNRRRTAGEVPSARMAITNHCSECLGFEGNGEPGTIVQQIRKCAAVECWLWPWRTGKLDDSLVD